MGTVIVLGIVLAASLVIASGVWVAIVLARAVTGPKSPPGVAEDRAADPIE